MVSAWSGPCKRLLSQSAESPEKGYQSCHVEPFSRLLHPLSSVSGSLRLFQLTPLHIALVSTVVALTVAAFTVVAFIVAASTAVYAPEWRWASVLLQSVLLQSVLPPPARITGQVIMRQ